MTRKNLVGAALAVLTSGLVLAGCAEGAHPGASDHGTTTAGATSAAPSTEHNDADVTFAQGMIPHHQGAIEMAELAQGRTTNAEVLDLASRVKQAQDPEIKTMTAWLDSWGVPAHGSGMDHGSDMPGMGDAELGMLKQAKDAEFDRMFLEMMIEHHQGAVDMANTELRQGSNADAKKLAQQVVDSQQAEITEMRALLRG
jgi:uncharacterized protein (DUF305 family)